MKKRDVDSLLDKAFEELNFLLESSSFTFFGHKFVSEKKYYNALVKLREAITLSLEDAKRIEMNAERVLEKAEEEANNIINSAIQEVEEMDKVKMAKEKAREILSSSRDKAIELMDEGEELKERSIAQAERVRMKIVNSTHEAVYEQLSNILRTMEESYKIIDDSLDKAKILIEEDTEIDNRDVS